MSKCITVAQIEQVKIAAKRLKKSFPDLSHTRLLDIAAYSILGVASYHEAQTRLGASPGDEIDDVARQPVQVASDQGPLAPHKCHYSGYTHLQPALSVGHWHFFFETRELCFDGEYVPYVYELDRLRTTGELLDFTLQLNKKFWPKDEVERFGICPDYQVKEFLRLIDWLCYCYFDTHIQGVFSPSGKHMTVNWEAALQERGVSAIKPFPYDFYETGESLFKPVLKRRARIQ